jgi:diaminopimelate decarboxylase
MDPIHERDGELHVEDVPASRIVSEFGTPTYVYSSKAIAEAYQTFADAFRARSARVCYAVKANSNLGVLSLLARLGAGFDIVSGGELTRVLRAGADPSRIVFSGVGKQTNEMEQALIAGIACFNVESASELHRLERVGASIDIPVPVSIRVNPDVDAQTHPYISTGLKDNKFGVSVAVARQLYGNAAKSPHLVIKGIDCHIGSQITSIAPFVEALDRILTLVDELETDGIGLEHIDLGGGIGVKYRDEAVVNVYDYAAAIIQSMGHRKQALWFEPGRFIVANAGILLTRVLNLKNNEGKRFAIVDAAMNDLIRPSLYGAWQNVTRVTQQTDSEPHTWDIVGPVCETGDFLAKDRRLSLAEGDLIAIHSAGAYGFVMSSNYNTRCRPAEVMVRENRTQCVRERETIDDLLRHEHLFAL